MSRPISTRDLTPSERRFLDAMSELGFGRFESVQIAFGKLVLDPWPSTVHDVKFGTADTAEPSERPEQFDLKQQAAEFFAYVRGIEAGQIRCLTVKAGLPFAMQVEHGPTVTGGHRD